MKRRIVLVGAFFAFSLSSAIGWKLAFDHLGMHPGHVTRTFVGGLRGGL